MEQNLAAGNLIIIVVHDQISQPFFFVNHNTFTVCVLMRILEQIRVCCMPCKHYALADSTVI